MGVLVPPVVAAGSLRERPQPRLRAHDLELRPWQASDWPALVVAYDDPEIRQWHVRTLDEAEAMDWIEQRTDRWAAETAVDWAVCVEDEVAARVGFRDLNLQDGSAEAAYWTLPSARGRGIASRGLDLATAWMLGEAGFHRLELAHSVTNEASCRTADLAGYVAEGVARQQVLHLDGWHDMHVHARLASDSRPDGVT
jgi:RimJ/RimL family protein N-acetyltransferase